MIEVANLRKQFGVFTAVDDISFKVEKGEVLGFLGPNGAGKSTTMKMITGFLSPDSGSVIVCGDDVAKSPIAVKKRIGYLPEGAPAYDDMTVLDFLRFIADVRGFGGAEKNKRIEAAIHKTNLESVVHKTIETLSKGFKRRVGLAQAILHDPPILVMDEPTDGLDPNQKHEVRLLIKEMAKEKAIIISTHILEEVDAICDRAIIIAEGKIKFDGTPNELEAMSETHNTIRFTLDGYPSLNVEKLLRGLAHVKQVKYKSSADEKTVYQIFASDVEEAEKELGHLAQKQEWVVDELFIEKGRLDDVFRRLTLGDLAQEGQKT
ncbi:MAG TPA: ATP-binding cassette domain-containing protein [Gammaproteobacteria bacterium]|nr:ATP-binding cassette domain-containing protein [Gammaproteobacteria bacterium]